VCILSGSGAFLSVVGLVGVGVGGVGGVVLETVNATTTLARVLQAKGVGVSCVLYV